MSRQRIETWVVWSLAVVVPGGLAILALWLSFRAAKRRSALRASAQRLSQAPRLSQVPGALQVSLARGAAGFDGCPAE